MEHLLNAEAFDAAGTTLAFASKEYYRLKSRLHDRLVDLIDLSLLDSLDQVSLRLEIRRVLERILAEERAVLLNFHERERLVREIQDEVVGYGPLEPLLQDPSISDILINGPQDIYVEKHGIMERSGVRFRDNAHLMKIIDKIVSAVGRRVDESSPMVDARLPDGSRVNVIIPPLAIDGPTVSIRRFGLETLELSDLIVLKSLTAEIGEILKGIVKARLNVLISGGTGSGKTTLLNLLSRFIPETERIITIEDAAELQLKQEHTVRLETRPMNIEGKGEITQRDLVRNSLRMRPDRIILGEVRGDEALDMLQAMNTGHDGSLATIHANSARDALLRLETMVAMAGLEIPLEFMRRFISSALDILIQVNRFPDGTRKLTSVQEVTGIENNQITLQEIFAFRQTGVGADGKVKGKFEFLGVRPRFFERFKVFGVEIPLVNF